MFSKLKIYIAVAFAALLAVVGIYRAGGKSATNEIKAKSEAKARDVEHLGYEAAREGAVKEKQIREEEINPDSARDFFEK
jgi:hypothetical protein